MKKSEFEFEDKKSTQLAIENTQINSHLGVLYDASLENTLTKMKTAKNFFKIEKRPNGDILSTVSDRHRVTHQNILTGLSFANYESSAGETESRWFK